MERRDEEEEAESEPVYMNPSNPRTAAERSFHLAVELSRRAMTDYSQMWIFLPNRFSHFECLRFEVSADHCDINIS